MKLKPSELCPGSGISYGEDLPSHGYPHCHVCGGVVVLTKSGLVYNHRRRTVKSPEAKKRGRLRKIRTGNDAVDAYANQIITDRDLKEAVLKTAAAYGRITSVTFRTNVELEPFQHAHVEAARSVGTDESPEEALTALKQFVAEELRVAKGGVRTVETPGRFRIP